MSKGEKLSWRPWACCVGIKDGDSPPAASDHAIKSLKLFKDNSSSDGQDVLAKDIVDLNKKDDLSGIKLWDVHEHHIKPGEELPKELQQGSLFTFPAVVLHWDATRSDYLQVTFTKPCKVYLLLVEKAREPAWVVDNFQRALSVNASSSIPQVTKLDMVWHLALTLKLFAILTQQLEDCKKAKLILYESKDNKVYAPFVTHKFGGMAGTSLLDYTYLFLWQPVNTGQAAGKPENKSDSQEETSTPSDAAENQRRRAENRKKIIQALHAMEYKSLTAACNQYQELLDQLPAPAVEPSAEDRSMDQRDPINIDDSSSTTTGASESMRNGGSRARCDGSSKSGSSTGGGDGRRGSTPSLATSALVAAGAPASAFGAAAADGVVSELSSNNGRSVPAGLLPAAKSKLRPAFLTRSGQTLTSIAVKECGRNPSMLVYLVSKGAELDDMALDFVLSNAKAFPACGYHDVQHFILSYIWHQRNPITCALVFAKHLRNASASPGAKSKEYSALARKLQRVAVRCIEMLEDLPTALERDNDFKASQSSSDPNSGTRPTAGGTAANSTTVADEEDTAASNTGNGHRRSSGRRTTLDDVLAPRGKPLSINDQSPLQVAYDTKDTLFMSTDVVQGYREERWLGAYYIANALQDVGNGMHFQNNYITVRVLTSAGFVGSIGQFPMTWFSFMLHIMILASRPFFSSPRGRWTFRLMSEVFLLYIFHAVQLMREDEIHWQHYVLVTYVASMLLDEAHELQHQYKRRLSNYFSDGFNVIEAIAMALLIGAGACKVAMMVVGEDDPSWTDLSTAKDLLYNTAPIFLWTRMLQYIIPLVDGLGALLMVISKMIMEVLKFAVPVTLVMMGVAFTLYSTFRDRDLPELQTFPNILLQLFRTFLGETMFTLVRQEDDILYNIYGSLVVLFFALASAVVLANLLIAVMSYHFDPKEIEAQSLFQLAEILQQYEYKVDQHLLGAPFSIVLFAAQNLLPSGQRVMVHGDTIKVIHSIGLQPPDGHPIQGWSQESMAMPTGSNELPYLFYLLTMYPVIMCATWALGLVMAPYCVFFFAFKGVNIWLPGSNVLNQLVPGWPEKKSDTAGGSSAADTKGSPASETGGDDRGRRGPSGNKVAPGEMSKGAAADMRPAASSDLLEELLDALEENQGTAQSEGGDSMKGAHSSSRSQPDDKEHLQAMPLVFLKHRIKQLAMLALLPVKCFMYLLTRPIFAVVGAFVYIVILIGGVTMVYFGVWLWFGRLAFSLYCVGIGWIQGWFGYNGEWLGSGAKANESTSTDDAHEDSHRHRPHQQLAVSQHQQQNLDQRWVRVNQAEMDNRGQVISAKQLREAMLGPRAGSPSPDIITEEELARAICGPLCGPDEKGKAVQRVGSGSPQQAALCGSNLPAAGSSSRRWKQEGAASQRSGPGRGDSDVGGNGIASYTPTRGAGQATVKTPASLRHTASKADEYGETEAGGRREPAEAPWARSRLM